MHMNYIKSQIEEVCGNDSEKIVCYATGSHSGFLTYDGIDVNGKRICDEILAETERLQVEKDKVTKFSLIGYSLGGLISRYAVGYLNSVGYFKDIQPMNFTTFCTPHVGVTNPGNSWGTRLYNYCTPSLLAHTGAHLFLTDKQKDKLPLLLWMSDPRSIFFKALKNFKNLSLYANVINDKRTSWYTSAISSKDPFKSMVNENASAYDLDCIEGYDPVVVDISKPIKFRSEAPRNTDNVTLNRGKQSILRKLNWVKVLFSVVVVGPVWITYLMIRTVYERINNHRRVASFYRDASNNLVHLYEEGMAKANPDGKKEPTINESNEESEEATLLNKVQDDTDTFVESVFNAMNSDSYKTYHDRSRSIDDDSSVVGELDLVNMDGAIQEFVLNLPKAQTLLIENLNKLPWKKFPVLIRKTKQTHRAAIYRYENPSFEEGKVVIKHYVNEIFEV